MENTILFPGISAPQLTPFLENGEIHYKEYTRLTRFLVSGGVGGIFVAGTTGEFVNLTIEERKKLLVAALEGVDSRHKILFNITALNLSDIQDLIAFAKQEGADAVSLTPPYYHSYDAAALIAYFVKIAQLAKPLPVFLYNIPSMVHNSITPEILEKVCSTCDNIKGIKDSSMDFMTFLNFQLSATDKNFELLTGNDAQVLTAMQAGGSGAVIALAGVFPQLCSSIYDHYQGGRIEDARMAQNTIMRLRNLVRGVIPVTAHKEMLKLQGFDMGKARFPFRDLTWEESEKIDRTVRELGLFM